MLILRQRGEEEGGTDKKESRCKRILDDQSSSVFCVPQVCPCFSANRFVSFGFVASLDKNYHNDNSQQEHPSASVCSRLPMAFDKGFGLLQSHHGIDK